MNQIRNIKGTHDILPEDSRKWQELECIINEVCSQFGYHEIRTPIFEETGLFSRSVGEETDIVSKEMYTFEDKASRSMSLRPEGTASVMRAFAQSQLQQLSTQHKFFYIGPLANYNRLFGPRNLSLIHI